MLRRHARHLLLLPLLGLALVAVPSARAADPVIVAQGLMPTQPADRPSAEPGMAVDGSGALYVSPMLMGQPPQPPNVANTWLPGSGLWRSRDEGRTYQWIGDPLKPAQTEPGFSFAGGDSDVAAAPLPNADGKYNVYAAALHFSEIAVAVSPDGGDSWVLLPAATEPGMVDRPWIAADGACTFYLAYHTLMAWMVERFDVCSPPSVWMSQEPASKLAIPIVDPDTTNALAGKLVVDSQHRVFLPMETCPGSFAGIPLVDSGGGAAGDSGSDSGNGCPNTPSIQLARSVDGGRTFDVVKVADVANRATPIWPATVAVGPDGAVHVAWFDEHDGFLSASVDGGTTWSPPTTLNAPGTTAADPTVTAGPDGVVRVAWYGADGFDGDANAAPPGTLWKLWLATSVAGGPFTAAAISDPVHRGPVCTYGGSCPSGLGLRNLFDDFGVVTAPSGVTAIAYTTDQPNGASADVRTAYVTVAPPAA
jgi:hypothetical protein